MQQTFKTSYQNAHTQHVSTQMSPSGVILINVLLLKVYHYMNEYNKTVFLIIFTSHTFYIQYLTLLHP